MKTFRNVLAGMLLVLLMTAPTERAEAAQYVLSGLSAGTSETMAVHVLSSGYVETVYIGTYTVNATPLLAGPPAFSALQVNCISPDQLYSNGLVYELKILDIGNPTKEAQINAILANAPIATADDRAGRAMALAEIAAELGTVGYNINTGNFFVTGAPAGAFAVAAADLANINNGTWSPDLGHIVWEFDPSSPPNTVGSQILVFDPLGPHKIPEPKSLIFFGLGVLLLGYISRKTPTT